MVLTPEAKAKLAERVQHSSEPFKAMPVRRVYIPKTGSNTKRRPLGIPVILDRCDQARVVNAFKATQWCIATASPARRSSRLTFA